MPPNLGGFFMVRSYYPSECHADYFDFERIEALKPAIEACGISTLSQSPMLGFHKQMDNRIKLLEEFLSFRIKAFKLDIVVMYFEGNKAVSDVRDDLVSVIKRLINGLSFLERFCLFVCRALSSIMVICMLTAIRLLLTFVMSLYLLLRS